MPKRTTISASNHNSYDFHTQCLLLNDQENVESHQHRQPSWILFREDWAKDILVSSHGRIQNMDPRSMDHPCGLGPWTSFVDPVHGPPLWTTPNC